MIAVTSIAARRRQKPARARCASSPEVGADLGPGHVEAQRPQDREEHLGGQVLRIGPVADLGIEHPMDAPDVVAVHRRPTSRVARARLLVAHESKSHPSGVVAPHRSRRRCISAAFLELRSWLSRTMTFNRRGGYTPRPVAPNVSGTTNETAIAHVSRDAADMMSPLRVLGRVTLAIAKHETTLAETMIWGEHDRHEGAIETDDRQATLSPTQHGAIRRGVPTSAGLRAWSIDAGSVPGPQVVECQSTGRLASQHGATPNRHPQPSAVERRFRSARIYLPTLAVIAGPLHACNCRELTVFQDHGVSADSGSAMLVVVRPSTGPTAGRLVICGVSWRARGRGLRRWVCRVR